MTGKILRFLLIAIMIILAISGLAGGLNLIVDSSGESLQLSTFLLESTIFNNFLIPGFILLTFLGIFPIIVAYGLITKSKSKVANKINLYKKRHWAWTYSLYCGIILILWIDIQVMLIGGGYTLQTVYAILGVLIIILTLSPEVMRFYKLKK